MASSWRKEKNDEMGESKQSLDCNGTWMSMNIIQSTQESVKVPAVVYKYGAWQAVEEQEGRSIL